MGQNNRVLTLFLADSLPLLAWRIIALFGAALFQPHRYHSFGCLLTRTLLLMPLRWRLAVPIYFWLKDRLQEVRGCLFNKFACDTPWQESCHPKGSRRQVERADKDPYEIWSGQSPASGKEGSLAMAHAGDWLSGEQLCWKDLVVFVGTQGNMNRIHEPWQQKRPTASWAELTGA